jgi:hypothetical protein
MYLVHFTKLDFQKTDPDDPKVPMGDPVTIDRGQPVPDWVTEFQINALLNAGMVVYAADRDPAMVPPQALPAQVRTPDQPVVLPSDPNGVAPVLADREQEDLPESSEPARDATPVAPPAAPVAPLPDLPKAADNKETWEQYATHPRIGMSLAEAEAMNKADLMTEVKRRHAAASEQ